MYFPNDIITGIPRTRFYAEPRDWSAVTDDWEYEDGGKDFNEVSSNAPRRWEYHFTLISDTSTDPATVDIFENFNDAARRANPFYFTDKYGATHYPVYIEEYSRTHDAHKPWTQFVQFKLIGYNSEVVSPSVPTVVLTDLSVVGANVQLTGNVSEASDLWLMHNGVYYSMTAESGGFVLTFPITGLDPYGTNAFYVVAVSATGGIGISNTLAIDEIPPHVEITEPVEDDTVSGVITVTAAASDDVEIDRVEFFYYDGLGFAPFDIDFTAPYSVSFDTTDVSNGELVLAVTAFDASGNSAEAFVTVTVSNELDFLTEGDDDFLTDGDDDFLTE
jgi:hypothetical protein